MSEKKSFVEKLMPAVGKMQENIYVSAITAGMMNAMPVLMASAIFQLFYSFPIPAWTNFLQSIGLYGLLTTVVNVCNLTALFIVFGIGRALGDKKGVDGVQCGLSALLCFLIITPLDVLETGTYISTSSLGAQGIFTAIIVALVAPSLYAFCIRKNIVIKMPAAVPEFVSKSFSGIPASLVTVVPFVAVRGLFSMTSWGSFTGFIYQVVQTPLTALGNSLPAHLIAIFVSCFLWWCGMHGTLVVFGACMAIWTAPMIENLNAYNAGLPIPYVLSLMSFFMIVQFLGGPGCLFGLYLNLAFATKSERYKATGKMCLVPGMFNIIEPVVYGLPIVMNPVLLVPFCGLPVVFYLAYYLLASAGIIGIPCVSLQVMCIPAPIAGFLLGGGVRLGIFCLICLAISCVVYYPFVKILDAQALKEEKATAAQNAAE